AATNVDLASLVEQKRFRADLYFRLNVLRLTMPPLRERRGDIALLAQHFVTQVCDEAKVPRKALSSEALILLRASDWPGDVRELLNVVQRAVVFSAGPTIQPCDISMPDQNSPASACFQDGGNAGAAVNDAPRGFREARARALEAFERAYVEDLLRKHGGNVT